MVARRGSFCNRPSVYAGRLGFAILTTFCLGIAVSACSLRLPMSPAVATSEDVTGSIAPSLLEGRLDLEDRRRAMTALAAALDPQGAGTPTQWDNPFSKNKGMFTPEGKPYAVDDQVCRAFSATIVKKVETERLTGTACLHKSGDWVISELQPEKKNAAQ